MNMEAMGAMIARIDERTENTNERVGEIHTKIFGDGTELGMDRRVDRLEVKSKNEIWWRRTVIMAAILTVGSAIASWTRHIITGN